MRRRLLIVAVFLLAGAVVNVAVAWGITLFIECLEPISDVADTEKPTVLWRRTPAINGFICTPSLKSVTA